MTSTNDFAGTVGRPPTSEVPWWAHLIIVESDSAFAGLKTFLDGPAGSGDADEFAEAFMAWVVAVVESEFAVIDGASNHVLVVGVVSVEECPVVDPEPFRADSAGRDVASRSGRAGRPAFR